MGGIERTEDSDASGLSMNLGGCLPLLAKDETLLELIIKVECLRNRLLPFLSTTGETIANSGRPPSTELKDWRDNNGPPSIAGTNSEVDLWCAPPLKESARIRLNRPFGGTGGGSGDSFSENGGILGNGSRLASAESTGKSGSCSRELDDVAGLNGA